MCHPRGRLDSPRATISSGARNGNGRKRMARTQLKIVALTPIPRVRQRTAAIENAGLLASVRKAKRNSESMIRWKGPPVRTFGRLPWLERTGGWRRREAAGGWRQENGARGLTESLFC